MSSRVLGLAMAAATGETAPAATDEQHDGAFSIVVGACSAKRYDLPKMRLGDLVMGACLVGCGPGSLTAVGSPGGVYQPDHGCTLVEASAECPINVTGSSTPTAKSGVTSAIAPQLRFEAVADTGMTNSTPGTLSGVQVTCQRSFCGTGALTAHADFHWDDSIKDDPRRMGTFVHRFDPPLDLLGRTVTFAVSVEGPTVPMHAQVGVVSDTWHWVAWSPVSVAGDWTRIAGVIAPDNQLIKLDPQTTSVLVHAINIDVYVPVAAASGTTGSWSGAIFLDETGW